MEFNGTPGPWRVSDDNITFSQVASDTYHQISAGAGYCLDDENKGFELSGFMSTSDANLIAAAPELLEALQECVYRIDVLISSGKATNLDIEASKKGNKAILKALGGE